MNIVSRNRLSLRPLAGPFGVQIEGVDLSNPPDDEVVAELIAAFHEHQVIRLAGQEMRFEDFERFGSWFGRAQPLKVARGRVPGFEGIGLLTNADEERRNAAAWWHTDNTYDEEPASATILWAETVPAIASPTLVADMYAAYESLPESTRKRIDALVTTNIWGLRQQHSKVPDLGYELAPCTHPLVLRHPVTGRKALYNAAGHSVGIVGWPQDEAVALLDELEAHATRPANVLAIHYTAKDVAAWDTLATLHAATQLPSVAEDPAALRRMYRISVKGTSAFAAPQPMEKQ